MHTLRCENYRLFLRRLSRRDHLWRCDLTSAFSGSIQLCSSERNIVNWLAGTTREMAFCKMRNRGKHSSGEKGIGCVR